MPVKFETSAYATITMFDDVAVDLLKMMGQSGTIPGAIRSEDISGALKKLRSEIATSARAQAVMPTGAQDPGDDNESPVTISNRAVSLIALLEAAEKEDETVTWQPG